MDLFKWTKNLKPKFPNVVEKFFGKKIDDQISDTEAIASVPSVNISDKGKNPPRSRQLHPIAAPT